MKLEYEEYLKELILASRASLVNQSSFTDAEVLHNKCEHYSKSFAKRFPELKAVPGFIDGSEHWWCEDMATGEIVDPTVSQFMFNPGYEPEYSPLSEGKYLHRIGRCMNCGDEMYSNEVHRGDGFCSDFCCTEFADCCTQGNFLKKGKT